MCIVEQPQKNMTNSRIKHVILAARQFDLLDIVKSQEESKMASDMRIIGLQLELRKTRDEMFRISFMAERESELDSNIVKIYHR